ncbi:hypothetical protein DL98DRAFT_218211 [Cadophora sp. DSE1049]|nr:hypothetical protein DL98DRAFT_218211 [Cadophora sp. DSE1049]
MCSQGRPLSAVRLVSVPAATGRLPQGADGACRPAQSQNLNPRKNFFPPNTTSHSIVSVNPSTLAVLFGNPVHTRPSISSHHIDISLHSNPQLQFDVEASQWPEPFQTSASSRGPAYFTTPPPPPPPMYFYPHCASIPEVSHKTYQ